MRKKKERISLSQIEVGEDLEPKIVEVPVSDAPTEKPAAKPEKPPEKKKSIGRQLVMTRLLGIDEDEKFINKRQKFFKRLFTAVFVIFVVGVLAFTFYRDFFSGKAGDAVDAAALWNIFSSCWYYLVFALVSLAFCFLIKGAKLSVVCRSMTKKWHFKTCLETGIIGYYYNNITPLAVGGQPFEIYHLSKHGVHGGVASSMPIIAFFMNQLAFVVMGIISLAFFKHNTLNVSAEFTSIFPPVISVMAIVGLICCLFMPTLVVTFSLMPRLGSKIVYAVICLGGKLKIVRNPDKVAFKTMRTVIHNSRCIKRFAAAPLTFILSFLLSVAEWCATCSIAYFTLRFFGFDMTEVGGMMEWLQITELCLILYAAISFIPTPGNSGAADLSFYALFQVKLMAGLAFSAMVVWRFLSFYAFIIVGFIFTTLKKKADKENEVLSKDIPL